MITTIRTGSQVLLVYPEGDCDWVTVIALTPDAATVRRDDGKVITTVIEDIGIGVDDDIEAVFDDGTTYPSHEPEPTYEAWLTQALADPDFVDPGARAFAFAELARVTDPVQTDAFGQPEPPTSVRIEPWAGMPADAFTGTLVITHDDCQRTPDGDHRHSDGRLYDHTEA